MTPKSRIASTGRTRANSAIVCPCSLFFRNFLLVILLVLQIAAVGEGRASVACRKPAPRHELRCASVEDVDHRHEVVEDAGGERDQRGDDGDRDDGENHAVFSHGLTLFTPANRRDQLGEVAVEHLRVHLPSSSRARLRARTHIKSSGAKEKLVCSSRAVRIWQATMVTSVKPPMSSA